MALLAAALAIWACGGDNICLSGSCEPSGSPTPAYTVSVSGNVSRFTTFVSDPTTVDVVVCIGLPAGGDIAACPKIFVAALTSTFTVSRTGVEPGSETIFFWIDSNQDGQVSPDDPIARLADPTDKLIDVSSGEQVSVTNSVVDFNTESATATITVGKGASPTPAPSPTP